MSHSVKNLIVMMSAAAVAYQAIIPAMAVGTSDNTQIRDIMDISSSPQTEAVTGLSNHAYDPIAELETEKEYRSSTSYIQNTIVFSVELAGDAQAESIIPEAVAGLCESFDLSEPCLVYVSSSEDNGRRNAFFRAKVGADDVWAVCDKMLDKGLVLSAEPDFLWNSSDVSVPSTGETDNEVYISLSGAEKVWKERVAEEKMPGEGVVVAVIDSGVDYTHPDLADNMWVNEDEIPDNGIDDDGNGYVDDVYGYDFVEGDGDSETAFSAMFTPSSIRTRAVT